MKHVFLPIIGLCFFIAGCSVGHTLYEDSYLVINVLDKRQYKDCAIKGSIHVPFDMVETFAEKLDKKTSIVFYCSNYACSASGIARDQLKEMGFSDVKAYEGGMAEWYQLKLPTDGPAEMCYLKADSERPSGYRDDVDHITAETLHQRMAEYALL